MKSIFEGMKSVDLNSLPDGVCKQNFTVKNYTKNTYNFARIDHEGNLTNKYQIDSQGNIENILSYEHESWMLLKGTDDEKCALIVFPKCKNDNSNLSVSILQNEFISVDAVPEGVSLQPDRLTQVVESVVSCTALSDTKINQIELTYNCKGVFGKKFQIVYWDQELSEDNQLGQNTYKLLKDNIKKVKILKQVLKREKDGEEEDVEQYDFQVTNSTGTGPSTSGKGLIINSIDISGNLRFKKQLSKGNHHYGETKFGEQWVISDQQGNSVIWICDYGQNTKVYKFRINVHDDFHLELNYDRNYSESECSYSYEEEE